MSVNQPILILQHAHYDWPGYLLDFFNDKKIPYVVINRDQGHELPNNLNSFSGFAIMGGAMSANDDNQLPYMGKAYDLLDQALRQRIPVIGHCLGGQMLARALGGHVQKADVSEIGWHTVFPTDSELSQSWWGQLQPRCLFQWHNETFVLPDQELLIASSEYCSSQAFVYDEIHLGMQFHVEALSDKIQHWLTTAREDIEAANHLNIQSEATILHFTALYEQQSKETARQLYSRWLRAIDL